MIKSWRQIAPNNVSDAAATSFVFIIIPVIYYFELFLILPLHHPPWSLLYVLHLVLGTFIMFNICSNFVAIMMHDTSIRGQVLPLSLADGFHYCAVCECVAPPRSKHCNTCRSCILKRDHHCMFTSCCIGHKNQRYFIVFLLYVFLATVYASIYNMNVLYGLVNFKLKSILMVLFPLATLFTSWTWQQMYILLILIVGVAAIFTGTLLYYHVDLMLKGCISYEHHIKGMKKRYDFGRTQNIEQVLGRRWYLTWLSAFVQSPLPGDGIHWMAVKVH